MAADKPLSSNSEDTKDQKSDSSMHETSSVSLEMHGTQLQKNRDRRIQAKLKKKTKNKTQAQGSVIRP